MKKKKLEEDYKTVRAKERVDKLRCAICPPNKGENAKRKPKYGAKTPKYKTNKAAKKPTHGCKPGCSGCDAE